MSFLYSGVAQGVGWKQSSYLFQSRCLMGSTTKTSECPQLLFCRLSVALKAATSLAVSGITGFPLHVIFPITCKVYPITFLITYFQNSMVFLGTNQDH